MTSSARRLLALTLKERISLLRESSQAAGPLLTADDLFFSRRSVAQRTFRLYGVDRAACRLPLASADERTPAAFWQNWQCFDEQYGETRYGVDFFVGAGRSLCDCFWPMIGPALDTLRAHVATAQPAGLEIDADEFAASALTSLHSRLYTICSRALVAELATASAKGLLHGETPKARFDFFVDCLRNPTFARAILEQYPVLIRQAALSVTDWRDALDDFLSRLQLDWPDIAQQFFDDAQAARLTAVEAGAGDSHNGFRTTMLCAFADGRRLVYKPRSLTTDRHFAALVDWFNRRQRDLAMRSVRVIDRGAYGWAEFVPQSPCRKRGELKDFYRRQGANLAFLHLLGGTDLHSENLIAAGAFPMLVDLETLFHPVLPPDDISGATRLAHDRLSDSVLRTGLLPYRTKELASPEDWIDLSGLGNAEERRLPFAMPVWEETDSDEIRLAHRRFNIGPDLNLPAIGGKTVAADRHVGDIVEGFSLAYRVFVEGRAELLDEKGPIAAFRGDRIRVVLRATSRYVTLLDESFHPDYLTDALDREALFDNLWQETKEQKVLARATAAERRDLWRGDVPYFWTVADAETLRDSTGDIVDNVSIASGVDTALRRAAALNEDDLNDQTDFIRAAFSLAEQKRRAAPVRPLRLFPKEAAPADPLQIAAAIGRRIVDTAIRDGKKCCWIVHSQTLSGHVASVPAGVDLYDGLPGIALFLATLAKATGDESFLDHARGAIAELLDQHALRRVEESGGAFAGAASVVYALSHISRETPELDYASRVGEIAAGATRKFAETKQIDVIGGLAGAVLAFVGASPDAFLAAAIDAGELLLQRIAHPPSGEDKAVLEGLEWPFSFAHGRAGLAYSLLRLFEASDEACFVAPALEILRQEARMFDKSGAGGHDDADVACQKAWCHGPPGVALAWRAAERAGAADFRERGRAIASTMNQLPLERSDCICHGNLGNALLSRTLDVDNEFAKGRQAFERRLLRRLTTRGVVCGNLGVETAGMMEGLSGIGLALLKIASPDAAPNVLVMAPR